MPSSWAHSFMDDILLCSKGEYRSVCMLVRGFPLFADSSGLQVSPSKSGIFCCGMEEDDIRRIKDMSGFSIGKFPFRYLGIPRCSKRISAGECEHLLDKISARLSQDLEH